MNYFLYAGLSLSIAIPVCISWIRFNKTDPAFWPFIWLITIGLYNELLNITFALNRQPSGINANIYMLASALLVVWLFHNLGLFQHRKYLLTGTCLLLVVWWIADNLVFSNPGSLNRSFAVLRAFIISLISIHYISSIILSEPPPLLKNAKFLVTMGLIISSISYLMVEGFMRMGADASIAFMLSVYELFAATNVFVNLLFAVAVSCIPVKYDFILRS